MAYKVIEPPETEAIELDDARIHLRVDADADSDENIKRLIVVARERAENELGRPLLPQTREAEFESFSRSMYLDEDVTGIQSIAYVDGSGAQQQFDVGSTWVSGGRVLRIVGALPDACSVTVTYACGAFTADTVPAVIVEWMYLHLAAMYENPSAVESVQTYELPNRFTDGLLDRYRVMVV